MYESSLSSSKMDLYDESGEDNMMLLGGSSPEPFNTSGFEDVFGNDTGSKCYINITTEFPIQYAQPLYGYCVPFLFVITIIANTLVVVVLAKRHMRTPTNVSSFFDLFVEQHIIFIIVHLLHRRVACKKSQK